MDLDVRLNERSVSILIEDPYRLDADAVAGKISAFIAGQGAEPVGLDVRGLLPLMVRGVAGCEDGCPANAKSLVERGYGDFALEYVEGGILTARTRTADGKDLILKLFPEF